MEGLGGRFLFRTVLRRLDRWGHRQAGKVRFIMYCPGGEVGGAVEREERGEEEAPGREC